MSAKEKDAFYQAALAIGRVVAQHPKLVPEEPEDNEHPNGNDGTVEGQPLRFDKGSNAANSSH